MENLAINFRRIFSAAILILIVLFAAAPGQPVAASDEFPQENAWGRSSPSVVWCGDPASTTTLEIHIVGRQDVVRLWLTDLGTDEEEGRAELFDDGSHGDLQAGDDVFTLAGVVPPCSPSFLSTIGGHGRWWGMLRVELEDGTRTGNNYGVVVGTVHPDLKNVFAVQDFGNGLSATAYAFFIEDAAHEVMDDYPVTAVYCGTSNFMAYRKLYSVLPDAFDFALVMPGMQILRPSDLAENVPYDVLVSNAVENIGVDIVDHGADFGSAGRLRSVIYHSFGSTAIVDHEVAHSWGAAIGQSLGLINEEYDVNQGHWTEMADVQGQLGAYYFDPGGAIGHFAYNGDQTWRLIPNTEVEPYSPLELYLMGLIPPEQVPPVHILQSVDTSDPLHITAASFRTVTIEEIVQAEGGPRLPSASESQKAFTLAFIVSQDVPYGDAAYAYFSLLSYELTSQDPPRQYSSAAPFYWATGGRATLDTRLPVDVPAPQYLPGGPTPAASLPTDTPLPAPDATPAPGRPSICFSIFGAIGLLLLPGAWRLLKKLK